MIRTKHMAGMLSVALGLVASERPVDAAPSRTGTSTVTGTSAETTATDGTASLVARATTPVASATVAASMTTTIAVTRAESQPTPEASSTVANTAVLGAASPEPPSNPYQLFFTLGLQVGTGTFISAANRDAVGYTLSASGLYRLLDVLDGRLDVFAVLSADQSLTTSSASQPGQVAPREFFFRDIRLGLLGRSLLNDKSTGIIIGANTSIDLPTSLQAQALGRVFRWNLSANATRLFSDVGPGSLLLRVGLTARRDFGPAERADTTDRALCDSVSVNAQGDCLAGGTTEAFGLNASLSTTYFIGRFNVGIGISFLNAWRYDASDSTIPPLEAGDVDVRQSPYAGNSPYSLIISTNISVTYTAADNLLFTLGLATAQGPVDKCNQAVDDIDNDTGQCVQFPFFDFNNQTNNLSSMFLNTTLMY